MADTEMPWERAPRRKAGHESEDDTGGRELLPVRRPDGQWQRRKAAPAKAAAAAPAAAAEEKTAKRTAELEQIAAEVESAAERRTKIAKCSALLLETPHKNIGLLDDLLQYASKDESAAIQRLALLSMVAVLRDLVPAYRIRPPTDKELKMQVSKEVELLRTYEKKLLTAYEGCVGVLRRWLKARLEAHRAAAVRGLCTLLDKAYDFNGRDELIAALVPVANESDEALRREACAALQRLYEHDTHGDATLVAVRQASGMLKGQAAAAVHPDLLTTWLSLDMSAAAASAGGAPANKRAKKRKRDMDPVARELAAAAGERGDAGRVQTQILEAVFVSYARIVKHGATNPLLPAVLKGIAKFAHQVRGMWHVACACACACACAWAWACAWIWIWTCAWTWAWAWTWGHVCV